MGIGHVAVKEIFRFSLFFCIEFIYNETKEILERILTV